MGRYHVIRSGKWHEMVLIEADSPDEALKIGKTVPDADWAATRKLYETDKMSLGGVSLSNTDKAWND